MRRVKSFLAAVFAMHPRDVLIGLAVVWVSIPAGVYFWLQLRNVGVLERVIGGQGDKVRTATVDWLTANVGPQLPIIVNAATGLAPMARDLIDKHATVLEGTAREEIQSGFASTDRLARYFGDEAMKRVDGGLVEVHHIHEVAVPVVTAATRLLDRYEAIPDELAASPAWKDIEAEIRCRRVDAFGVERGYSACIKSGIIGVIQEAKNVGGVFTKKFPELSDSLVSGSASAAGMLNDGHELTSIARRWAKKNVDPRPLTNKEKAKAVLVFSLGAFIGLARAGIL